MKNRKKRGKRESGQAIVEFALVLPLFLLLVMGIMDFGWLFYNYISVENAARNGARIACVEYMDTCYDKSNNRPNYTKTYAPLTVLNNLDERGHSDVYSDEEINIVRAVDDSLPESISQRNITIRYSYDQKAASNNNYSDYIVNKRSDGDVTVTVTGKMHVLTPVLGAFSEDMQRELTSSSTFKVELHPNSDGDE